MARRPVAVVLCLALAGTAWAEDWTRFRGPNGSGVSPDKNVPTVWDDTQNILWKVDLPGPGSSSPIITGPDVIVTAYSGYGVERSNPGNPDSLTRHLLCFDRHTGEQKWKVDLPALEREDRYTGMMAEHGYATSTPVTDGERVYVFCGKSGVYAFDLSGKQLWHVGLGTGSAIMGWGSGASPVLYENLLLVNADAESEALVALDKMTGKEVWRASSKGYKGSWSTPTLLKVDGETEIVLVVPDEVWGINPKDGKLKWFCECRVSGTTSPIVGDGIVYVLSGGPRGAAALAIRGGAKGDAKANLLWRQSAGSYVPSPVLVGGDKLAWEDDKGLFHCHSTKSGEELVRERLPGAGKCYASITAAGDKLYAVSREKGTFVLRLSEDGKKVEQLAHNEIASDDTDFNASPAVVDDHLFLRSNKRLYCVGTR
ncbi:MAG TPA: PQQ-binding-like beta-propeller repeat protein [Planctomycetaceae bacterium]|nr:PQQ-binding-like beta-propeller repeat protein [Planctomycetaceae bacterium]